MRVVGHYYQFMNESLRLAKYLWKQLTGYSGPKLPRKFVTQLTRHRN